jgi:hypothetical protein
MRAQFEVASRLAVPCLALINIAAVVGCGGGGGGGGPSSEIEFTKSALKSMPLVKPPAPVAAARLVSGAPVTPTSIGTDWFTAQLFKMECREAAGNQGVDYCPAGTPTQSAYGTALGSDPYGFDMQALTGFVYAAQRDTLLTTSCSGHGLAARTVSATDYYAAISDASAGPTRFIFDQFDTYACRSSQVADPAHETMVVSAATDGSYQTGLHTRYEYVAGGETQTDLTQVDVTMNAGTPEFVALNFASSMPFSSRLVLLVNLTNHRFAMKYYTPHQPSNMAEGAPERYAVVAGIAGYDLATGQPNEGHYYISFLDPPFTMAECVNNATGAFEADFTLCDVALDHTSWSAIAVKGFLGVPDTTAARIGQYLHVFDGTADLAIADGWTDAMDQTTQRDLYWPAGLK